MICKLCNRNEATKIYCKTCFNKMQYGLVLKINGKMTFNEIEANSNGYDFLNYHKYKKCILCDTVTNNEILCNDCKEKVDKIKSLYSNRDTNTTIVDYYNEYNSKFSDVIDRSIKMLSLSILCYEKYNNNELLVNVVDDIKYILNKKIQKKQDGSVVYLDEINTSCIKNRNRKTLDGHIVKSEGEEIIDNILCNHNIFHIYEPEVKEIKNTDKKTYADWAIPIKNTLEVIYIEYFGMITKYEYNQRALEKISLYKQNNLNLIIIEKNEIRNSTMLEGKIIKTIEEIKKNILKKLIENEIKR